MKYTTIGIHKMLRDDDIDIDYNVFIITMGELKAMGIGFETCLRSVREYEEALVPDYTLNTKQAVMLIVSTRLESIVYLVRELIYLEDVNNVKLEKKVTSAMTKTINDSLREALSDVKRAIINQSATMDGVDIVINTLNKLVADNKNQGSVTLAQLSEMLSEAIGRCITIHETMSTLIHCTEGEYKRNIIFHNNVPIIQLPWLAGHLDEMMISLIDEEEYRSDEKELSKYIGEPA